MDRILWCVLVVTFFAFSDCQHYTRNRPGGVGYKSIHIRQGRDLREEPYSFEEPQGQNTRKCAHCDLQINRDAIQLKVKERQESKLAGDRLKRYILSQGVENVVQARSKFMPESWYEQQISEGVKKISARSDGQKESVPSRRTEEDEEEECECDSAEEEASEDASLSRPEDIKVESENKPEGGNPTVEFAEPWYDEDEPNKPDQENGNDGSYEDSDDDKEEDSSDDSADTSAPEVDDDTVEEENSESSGCKCVSVFQCGVSYKIAETMKKEENEQCGEDEVCCTTVATAKPPEIDPPKQQQTCGTARPNYSIRLSESGFDRALYGEFPWTVLITRFDKVHCAGTLIHPQIVLTAANCIFNQTLDSLTVQAAAYDLNAATQSAVQSRLIDTYILHPSFRNLMSLGGNLALLQLGDPVDLGDDVNTICLASQLSDVDLKNCVANGWGRLPQAIPSDPVEMPQVMKKLQLPFFTRDVCQQTLRREFFGKTFRLSQGVFCAGGEKDVDMCTGDGGGPLICPLVDGSGMAQVGIVAGGLGCGKANIPGFYIDVIHYRTWIEENKEKLLISLR